MTAPEPRAGEDEGAVAALLDRAAAGDRTAAGDLVTRFDERLRRIVRARLDPRVARRADADDVMQEVHVEALGRLPAYARDRSMPFFLWLRFLAVQRCAALARHHLGVGARDARRETSLAPAATGATSTDLFASHLAASGTSPSAAAARHEVHQRLRLALDAMDPPDRDVLWLRHFEALDNAEVAAVLAIEPSAASKRYVRALARLRDVLAAIPGLSGVLGR